MGSKLLKARPSGHLTALHHSVKTNPVELVVAKMFSERKTSSENETMKCTFEDTGVSAKLEHREALRWLERFESTFETVLQLSYRVSSVTQSV
jgi:hypothetical protein